MRSYNSQDGKRVFEASIKQQLSIKRFNALLAFPEDAQKLHELNSILNDNKPEHRARCLELLGLFNRKGYSDDQIAEILAQLD